MTTDRTHQVAVRWFWIGVAFTQFANVLVALWVRAGAPA